MAEIAVGGTDGGISSNDGGDVASCSDAADVCLTIDGGDLNYTSSSDIYGFQFDHDGCATGASGGDATSSGFIVQGSATTVLGFSFSGGFVPAGSGTFVSGVDCASLSNLIFSGVGGSAACG